MKITDIKAYPVWVGRRNLCLVKVETDEGLYGWGESGVSGRELAVIGAIRHFREFLVGKDASRIGAIWQELYRGQYFEGGRVLAGAISAIDIALWDIAGKALGQPIHRLLGGRQRDRLECFITTVKPHDQSLVEDVKKLADMGWRVIRATAGEPGSCDQVREFDVRQSITEAASVLREAREEVGSGITLGIDYHHRLSVAETASFCQRMPSGTIDFIEEPIRCQTPAAYESLRAMIDVPFAIGEEFASKWDFMPYIENGITNFARIDVCNVGGITEALKVASAAETHYIDVMPHDPLGPICTAATIQCCAVMPNFAWCEVPPYETCNTNESDTVFINSPELSECYYSVGNAPGHGVDVIEEEVAERTFKFWEAPRLKKPDGSFTNW